MVEKSQSRGRDAYVGGVGEDAVAAPERLGMVKDELRRPSLWSCMDTGRQPPMTSMEVLTNYVRDGNRLPEPFLSCLQIRDFLVQLVYCPHI